MSMAVYLGAVHSLPTFAALIFQSKQKYEILVLTCQRLTDSLSFIERSFVRRI